MIQLKKVSVTYPGGVEALRGVDLTVGEGEFVVVVGLSGAGKSTLLRVLNGLVPATSGSVVVDGTEVVGASAATLRRVRSRIGMIFQTFNLIPQLTVLENLEVPLFYQGVPMRERRDKALALAESIAQNAALVNDVGREPPGSALSLASQADQSILQLIR